MQFVAIGPVADPIASAHLAIAPAPPALWEGPQESYPDWLDPQISDLFRHELPRHLDGRDGDDFRGGAIREARLVCRSWHRMFFLLAHVSIHYSNAPLLREPTDSWTHPVGLSERIFCESFFPVGPYMQALQVVGAHLRYLNFRNVGFHDTEVIDLVNCLVAFKEPLSDPLPPWDENRQVIAHNAPHLYHLTLACPLYGPDGVRALGILASVSPALRDLSLSADHYDETSLQDLVRGIRKLGSLRHLAMGGAGGHLAAWTEAATLFSEGLQSFRLEGQYNGDRGEPYAAFFGALATADKLANLELYHSTMIGDGIIKFVNALPLRSPSMAMHPLKRITLYRCWLDLDGELALAHFVESPHSQLVQLNLRKCSISESRMNALMSAVANSKTLRFVDISKNYGAWAEELFRMVRAVFASNKTIEQLLAQDCGLENFVTEENRAEVTRLNFTGLGYPFDYRNGPVKLEPP